MLDCLDIYARPIMLIKGGEKYRRSKFGGIVSLLAAVIVLFVII